MMKKLKIGVVGAGNIGSAIAAMLGNGVADVTLTARGTRLQALRENGVTLRLGGETIHAPVTASEVLDEVQDAVLLCVKSQQLSGALDQNWAAIGPDTLVIPMVNGWPFWFLEGYEGHPLVELTADEQALDALPADRVLGTALMMKVEMQDGVAVTPAHPEIHIGTVTRTTPDAKMLALFDVMRAAGIKVVVEGDIRRAVVMKMLLNIATNPLSALADATIGGIVENPDLRAVSFAMADEFRRLTTRLGYDLPDNDWLGPELAKAGPHSTSMLQDARDGRELELGAIVSMPLRTSRAYGFDMPVSAALLDVLQREPTLPLKGTARAKAIDHLNSLTQPERTFS